MRNIARCLLRPRKLCLLISASIEQHMEILIFGESYGCGTGIVGGRIGGWGIGNEGGVDPVVINRSKDGLAASVTFRSTACPFLYTVKVTLSPTDLC